MSGAKFTAIGIDVGGTKIAAGVVSFPGGTVGPRKILPTEGNSAAALESVYQTARELADQSRQSGVEVGGIGLGLCEIVTRDGTIASRASLQWSETEIRDRLSTIVPVVIEADVRAAARAEALFGAGKGLSCFLYVSIGTGISCCLVIEGEPFVGARGAAGTMASGPMPTFGSKAPGVSLEQIASGPALRERYAAAGGNARSAKEVLAAADRGDKNAIDIVCSGAAALGASIGWLVNVLDPQSVILGGGLGLSEGLFRETLVGAARKHIWWHGHRDVRIVSAQTGTEAGIIGAAATAWRQLARD